MQVVRAKRVRHEPERVAGVAISIAADVQMLQGCSQSKGLIWDNLDGTASLLYVYEV